MGQVDADHPWPTLPSEHPTLPRLVLELHDAVVEELGRGGQVRRSASPAFARVLFSPLPVLATSSPDRLRELARNLDRMADVLAEAHGDESAFDEALDEWRAIEAADDTPEPQP